MSPSSRMSAREDGWVLVSAIVLMAIMLSVGLASFKFVDTGQKRSRESRERESSLKSIRHGVDGHDTPFSVSVASASAGS